MKKIFIRLLTVILFSALIMSTLVFAADKWRDGKTDFFDGDDTDVNDIDTEVDDHMITPLERFMITGRFEMALQYSSASQIVVSSGSVVCSNSGATLVETRRNTSNTTVTWSDIDTGGETGSTTHYIYANCDADATTATFKISTSSSAPSGVTMYKKLGSFYNDSSSNIDRTKIYTEPYGALWGDSTGRGFITDVRDFGTSASSYTAKSAADIKICFGRITVSGSSSQAITGLPYTSASTYQVIISKTADSAANPPSANQDSGSQFTAYNNHGDSTGRNGTFDWITIGH